MAVGPSLPSVLPSTLALQDGQYHLDVVLSFVT